MRAILLTVAAVCGFTALTSTATAAPAADPRAKLDTAIDEGIRLLEDEEYVEFLKMFVPPDELKKITEKRSDRRIRRRLRREERAAVDPVPRPAFAVNLHAAILHLLGIDHTRLTYRHNGANRRLTDVHGEVIKAILS